MSCLIWFNGIAYLPAFKHEALAAERDQWKAGSAHVNGALLKRIAELEAALRGLLAIRDGRKLNQYDLELVKDCDNAWAAARACLPAETEPKP